MQEDGQTIELKNKISELKQRLNQIYAQYFADTTKGRVFETEFSLFLKACENARDEISESTKLQYDVIKIGLSVLIALSALSVYLFKVYVLFGMLTLLGFGFAACGFMYLLLLGEIKISRARGFCNELELYFKRHRWSTELKESLNLPDVPLWGEYAGKWDELVFDSRHFERKSLYAPFRIMITLMDLLALGYLIQSFITKEQGMTPAILTICLLLWIAAVVMQILLVHSILHKVGSGLHRIEERNQEVLKKFPGEDINWQPQSWINFFRLFFIFDIVFPRKRGKYKS